MAVEAVGSKFSRQNAWIFMVLFAAGGLYFAYDGWMAEGFQNKHLKNEAGISYLEAVDMATQENQPAPDKSTFKPDANLQFNRVWGPIICGVIVLWNLISAMKIPGLRLVADDEGLLIDGKTRIAYSAMKTIDKRYFEKEGYFTVGYEENGNSKSVKLSNRKYDDLKAVFEEVVNRTGATPQSNESQDS